MHDSQELPYFCKLCHPLNDFIPLADSDFTFLRFKKEYVVSSQTIHRNRGYIGIALEAEQPKIYGPC